MTSAASEPEHPLQLGLSWDHAKQGFAGRWVFRCVELELGDGEEVECGRQQGWAPPGRGGGVTVEEAKRLGWEQDPDGHWTCPFCAGNVLPRKDEPC